MPRQFKFDFGHNKKNSRLPKKWMMSAEEYRRRDREALRLMAEEGIAFDDAFSRAMQMESAPDRAVTTSL